MLITIARSTRLFVDIEGCGLVPDGPSMRSKPTLLLVHGGPGYDHSSFKPIFSRLADVAQVICVDRRGHGRSDRRPACEWLLDIFAHDVVRLCEALGVAKPVVLGQSFSGFVAQRYLARHPAHPARVVLSSTAPHMRSIQQPASTGLDTCQARVLNCTPALRFTNAQVPLGTLM